MSDTVAGDKIRIYLERVEALEKEKTEIQEHIKETFEEAKSDGFDVKILKQVLKIRKMSQDARDEQETLLQIYLNALEGNNNAD